VKRQELVALAASVLVLGAVGAYAAVRFEITTDVSELLPADGDKELVSLTRRVADSELGRTMVLLLGAADPSQLAPASKKFEAELRAEPRVQAELLSLEGGPPEGGERAIYELYHPRRFSFLAPTPEQAKSELSPAGLQASAQRLKERLAMPLSPLITRLASSDPLLVLMRLFERIERAQAPTLRPVDGRFLTRAGEHAVLFLRTKARAFDADAQAPLLAGVTAAFAATQRSFAGLTLEESGANRFAVKAAAAIRGDIERVSTLSMLGLGLLLFLLFRSLRLLAVAALPLGAGFLVGLAACLAVYGRIHGVTLAFGSSLLGVALDFVEHLYCHQAVAPDPDGARGTLRQIAPAMITGAATPLVGFVALAGSGFRGLQEVALFSSTGLIAALITTFTMLPALLPAAPPRVRLRDRAVAMLGAGFVALRAHRRRLWVLPAAALGVACLGLPRVRLSEDFTLGQLDRELLAEDQRVRDQVARFEQTRFVVALGPDEDAALAANDRVAVALSDAQGAGELGGYRNVADLLPSPARQRAVSDAVRGALGDGQILVSAFEAEGFRAGAFGEFLRGLAAPAPAPLRFADLASSPLAGLVAPFRLSVRGEVGVLSFLQDVAKPEALARRLAAIPGARFIDQHSQLRSMHQAYQARTVQWVALGTLGVLVLLALRYRELRKTLAAFLPSLLAAAVTVACLALSGRKLDLIALAALLIVISMGVDYGVFLVDAAATEDEPTTALLSIFFAASTTVLGFGLLALSEHPLLSTIGMTAWVGMTVCAILAPTTLVLLGEQRPGAASKEAA
jgi:predicted exporter